LNEAAAKIAAEVLEQVHALLRRGGASMRPRRRSPENVRPAQEQHIVLVNRAQIEAARVPAEQA
jgi:hypothetical protein